MRLTIKTDRTKFHSKVLAGLLPALLIFAVVAAVIGGFGAKALADKPPNPITPGNKLVHQEDCSLVEYGEDGVPTGEWRWDDDLAEWIFDGSPPLGNLPRTGDAGVTMSLLLLFLGVLLPSLIFALKPGFDYLYKSKRNQK